MSKPASGLGRGLSALLGEQPQKTATTAATDSRGVREVEIARIHPNPAQPRVYFDEASLTELAESIAQRGVLQPILLRPDGDGFMIIAGERRWRAAQKAQLHAIPAIVREIDDATTAELALIENIQREDLNALEEAEAYRQLIKSHGHGQDEVARLVNKSRSHVANLLRLLDLPEFVRSALMRGDITMGHARAVASADTPEEITREIIAKGLSVRQAEALARKVKPGAGSDMARAVVRRQQREALGGSDVDALERQLSDVLGLRVKVSFDVSKGGTVSLHYSSLDQLDLICQRLTGEPI
ncbi:ParB/RepB/Spo0J family partition protein [Sphingomonas piscis]|uniref:ParB/RepB/Spo0J family partition protein n=1 Tax=Sphingomonas piscis TaxID=2714943 RepID=A0A6G7YPM7_9SPHN|nr:ParB/RepB/Spo0J family partition protein [Sphingomonas piscis]QIK78695.1 ParB/RepB/Spo0J family partition protein [Sphingomonas piscis]